MTKGSDPLPLEITGSGARLAARGAAELLSLRLKRGRMRTFGNVPGGSTGSSLDFQDHRMYAPGDDPRHIDWSAYARSGHYMMKLFRDETRPIVDILFDVSPSMRITAAKAARSLELAYFCLESALRAGASASLCMLDGKSFSSPDPEGSVEWPDRPSMESDAPDVTRAPLRTGALRVFVSDLLFSGPPEPILQALLASKGRAVILAPNSTEESDPDWFGSVELQECETNESQAHHFDEGNLRRYREAYDAHFRIWRDASLRFGIPLGRVAAGPPLVEALQIEALPSGAVELAC